MVVESRPSLPNIEKAPPVGGAFSFAKSSLRSRRPGCGCAMGHAYDFRGLPLLTREETTSHESWKPPPAPARSPYEQLSSVGSMTVTPHWTNLESMQRSIVVTGLFALSCQVGTQLREATPSKPTPPTSSQTRRFRRRIGPPVRRNQVEPSIRRQR